MAGGRTLLQGPLAAALMWREKMGLNLLIFDNEDEAKGIGVGA